MPEEMIPTEAAPVEQSDSSIAPEESFPWRGGTLQLAAALPQGPAEASVFLLQPEEPATVDEARQLAERFGVEGPVYITPGRSPDSVGYLITDGRQRLFVQSALTYDYYADYPGYSYMGGARDLSDEEAAAAIDRFLTSHGFDFDYEIENPYISPGMYYVLPRTADGRTIRYNYGIPERLAITLDAEGNVMLVSSYRVAYETVGVYGIRSAEEVFQQVLGQPDGISIGVMEITKGVGNIIDVGSWSRTYPDDQTITLYSQVTSYPALEPGGSPLITLAQHPAQGNVAGMENLEPGVLVEATGQFKTENGIRAFHVESWKVSNLQETGASGTLRQEGEEIIFTTDGGGDEYIIVDAPAGLPLNTTSGESFLMVNGIMVGDRFEWNSIQYFPPGSRGSGGGGGGGPGFYQLNLSGTPVPFPTEAGKGEYIVQQGDTLQSIAEASGITVDELMQLNDMTEPMLSVGQTLILPDSTETPSVVGQRVEGQRGIVIISIFQQADGSERMQYGFSLQPSAGSLSFAILEGSGLEALQAYHNRPIDVWGTVQGVDSNGTPVLLVERFEIPFPDLDFQILKGTQRLADVNGQQVALFTAEDGTTYAQILTFDMPDTTILDSGGAPVLLETLAIPGETFGGYPALRIFAGATYMDESTQLSTTANRPYYIGEAPPAGDGTAPTLTIEKIELVYYVPDPRYGPPDPNAAPTYIQPAWRFYGHYSTGKTFELLVQALKEEYLLPEFAPYTPPG